MQKQLIQDSVFAYCVNNNVQLCSQFGWCNARVDNTCIYGAKYDLKILPRGQ